MSFNTSHMDQYKFILDYTKTKQFIQGEVNESINGPIWFIKDDLIRLRLMMSP